MKKKPYLHPTTEVVASQSFRLMDASRGWSQDGNPPYDVTQENEVNENDKLPSSENLWGNDDEYGGFLDLE